MHFEVLLEEESATRALDNLLQDDKAEDSFNIHPPYNGKRIFSANYPPGCEDTEGGSRQITALLF